VLVNNAGLMSGQRRVTADGFDEVFAVNHLAPFLLTSLLLGKLTAAAARVITVTSGAHSATPAPSCTWPRPRRRPKLRLQ
jgi:NAD(P)-dependent dehydrogenase (short-subunit alcohol dehydrogenase family)